MAPSRKSKGVVRKSAQTNESPRVQNFDALVKNCRNIQKRKVSDMLGPQWTKEEIQRFYKAFRKLGQNWEKVSASVRTRSPEMVEALYTMNRAYLSLSKGHASLAGLIAMMTDYYSNLGGSESDQDVSGAAEFSRKASKRSRAPKGSEGKSFSNFGSSKREDEGCLSSLMNRRCVSRPWAVGKRTPRVPVSFVSNKERGGTLFSPLDRNAKLNGNLLDDDVTHEIALALTEASQRGGSPQFSRTPSGKEQPLSPAKDGVLMKAESEMASTKLRGEDPEETCSEISLGSSGAGTAVYSKEYSSLKNILNIKAMPEMDGSMRKLLDDIKEACSRRNDKRVDEKVKMNQFGVKYSRSPNKGLRKKINKPIVTEDNDTSFQALQALADLSLRLPEPTADTESSAAVKDEIDTSITALSKQGTRKRRRKQLETNDTIYDVKDPNALQMDNSKQAALEVKKLENKHNEAGINSNLMSAMKNLPRSRRKLRTPKVGNNTVTERISSDDLSKNKVNIQKETLANCLSWYQVRRWCTYEMFCSAIDYPWFARREFVEYLNHVGLGHIPKLTQVEWGVIRSSLGKPRRFSEHFLKEEKGKLYQYRESVRKHYSDIRSGILNGLPTDLARPLSVGQRVLAIHPKTRELHDGSVLTVDHNRCIIQFDQPELGVEFVLDVDCMPLNALEQKPSTNDIPVGVIRGNHMPVPAKGGSAENANCLHPKETAVSEVKRMNGEALNLRNDFKNSEPFKNQYASVIVELSQINEQATCLRQRGAYYDSDNGGSESAGIVENSRSKAKCMVAAATQSIPNDDRTMEEAIDVVNKRLLNDDFTSARAAGPNDAVQLPSKLITECVATLLMIQRCTERHFPPGDVAQLLDSAVTSLSPCCPQNIPIYSDIQKCMGIIKNKILALVPT